MSFLSKTQQETSDTLYVKSSCKSMKITTKKLNGITKISSMIITILTVAINEGMRNLNEPNDQTLRNINVYAVYLDQFRSFI